MRCTRVQLPYVADIDLKQTFPYYDFVYYSLSLDGGKALSVCDGY